MVAAEAMLPLQILIGLAVAKSTAVDIGMLVAELRRYLNLDPATVQTLIDSVRVRAGVTPEGNIAIEAVE